MEKTVEAKNLVKLGRMLNRELSYYCDMPRGHYTFMMMFSDGILEAVELIDSNSELMDDDLKDAKPEEMSSSVIFENKNLENLCNRIEFFMYGYFANNKSFHVSADVKRLLFDVEVYVSADGKAISCTFSDIVSEKETILKDMIN